MYRVIMRAIDGVPNHIPKSMLKDLAAVASTGFRALSWSARGADIIRILL
jgi:hypothetical protein